MGDLSYITKYQKVNTTQVNIRLSILVIVGKTESV